MPVYVLVFMETEKVLWRPCGGVETSTSAPLLEADHDLKKRLMDRIIHSERAESDEAIKPLIDTVRGEPFF